MSIHATAITDVAAVQRRTLWVLMAAVIAGGAGTSGAFSVVAVLGEEITGSATLGGTAASAMGVGTALLSVPLAKYMAARGRRVGLSRGYLVGLGGALVGLVAGLTDVYALLVLGLLALGAGNACGLASRFAVVDLAAPAERARTIGFLVGATTVGAVAGPSLALGPTTAVASAIGIEELTAPFLFSALAFAVASVVVARGLRPDPLLLARDLGDAADTADPAGTAGTAGSRTGTLGRSLGLIVHVPAARLATVAMMAGQSVMVSTMVMAPLHMTEGGQELRIVGLVISVHILGMYALAPLVGWATGRIGPVPMIILGGVVSFTGAEIAAYTPPDVTLGMFAGMFGVGLGWNCCLVAGTALFAAVVSAQDRVPVQGAADLLMTGSGSIAGIAGGAVVAWQDFQFLSHYSALVGAALAGLATIVFLRNPSRQFS